MRNNRLLQLWLTTKNKLSQTLSIFKTKCIFMKYFQWKNDWKKICNSLIFLSQNGKRVENHSFPPLPLHLLLPFNNVIEQKQEEHDKSIYFHLGHILRQRSRQLIILNQLAVFSDLIYEIQIPLDASLRFLQNV